jgi:hypothetical protein
LLGKKQFACQCDRCPARFQSTLCNHD